MPGRRSAPPRSRTPAAPSAPRAPGPAQQGSLFPNSVAPPTESRPGATQHPQARTYRRADQSLRDDEGWAWVNPSSTAWPNVQGNPPGPRTQVAGYNRDERTVRILFRPDKGGRAATYEYREVPPDVWERIRRTASTGRFINRILDDYPYSRTDGAYTPRSAR